MKKILVAFLFLVVAFGAFGQSQILYRDTFTILWNPPAPPPELLTGESLVYRVYLWDMAAGAPPATPDPGWQYWGETALLEMAVIVPTVNRQEWAVGIQSVLIRADATEVASQFARTTELADIDPIGEPGVPFVYAPDGITIPLSPEALRDSGM